MLNVYALFKVPSKRTKKIPEPVVVPKREPEPEPEPDASDEDSEAVPEDVGEEDVGEEEEKGMLNIASDGQYPLVTALVTAGTWYNMNPPPNRSCQTRN